MRPWRLVVDEMRAASSNCPLKPNPAEAEVAAAPRPGFAIATAAMTSLASNGMRDGTYTGPATDVVAMSPAIRGSPSTSSIFITRVRGPDH